MTETFTINKCCNVVLQSLVSTAKAGLAQHYLEGARRLGMKSKAAENSDVVLCRRAHIGDVSHLARPAAACGPQRLAAAPGRAPRGHLQLIAQRFCAWSM